MHHWHAGGGYICNALPTKGYVMHQRWKNGQWCITVSDIKTCALLLYKIILKLVFKKNKGFQE